jgi:hypothetical protein
MRSLFVPILLAIVFVGCASTTGTKSARRSMNVITAEEIAATSARSAYEAVQLLRPQWLSVRGVSTPYNLSAVEPIVYLDNVRYGPLQSLETIHILDVKEIQFLKPRDATTRFGTGHMGGAILVTRKR